MKVLLSVFLIQVIMINALFAQTDNVWAFGYRAGLDFTTNPPTAVMNSMVTREPSASVSDGSGNLLFYTNGNTVWAADNTVMPNGSDLNPYANGGINPLESTSQGALIVPVPQVPHRFYIFSLTSEIFRSGELYYSVVDMRLNNNKGDIVQGQKAVFLDASLTEQMISVSGTDCNIWLLNISVSGFLKARRIDVNGIDTTPVISSVEISNPRNSVSNYGGTIGCMALSSDNSRLAIARFTLSLFDFDNTTGTASNGMLLFDNNEGFYGTCFSQDNSKLYTSSLSGDNISQFDLSFSSAGDIAASRVRLIVGNGLWQLKRGPDHKIYIAKFNSSALDVILQPNLTGIGCQYTVDGQNLLFATTSRLGLSNSISLPVLQSIAGNILYENVCNASHVVLDSRADAIDVLWNTGSNEAAITVSEEGIYWVKMTLPGCISTTDTFKVSFFAPELVTQNSCHNSNTGKAWVLNNGNDSITQYVWMSGQGDTLSMQDTLKGVIAGNYEIYMYTVSGCRKAMSFNIAEDYFPLSFDTDSQVCMGDQVLFKNTSHSYYTSFAWDFGDRGESDDADPIHRYVLPGTYTISLMGKGAICTDTVYATIMVSDTLPNVFFTVDENYYCTGEAIQFTVLSPVISIPGYHWEWGDANYLVSSSQQEQHSYESEGDYGVTLLLTHPVCPSKTFSDTLHIKPPPLVELGRGTSLCLGGRAIELRNLHENKKGYRYLWSNGSTMPMIQVKQPGVYSLTIINEYGCAATETTTVGKDCNINIPNTFTPNNDGANDYFFPRQLLSKGIVSFRMQVFNRWGKIVFATDRTDGRGWDGKVDGKSQPEGGYAYTIQVTYMDGNTEKFEGSVTLVR